METVDRAGQTSTDRSWSDEPCPGTCAATRAAGAAGPHSRPQAARSIYTARSRWPESTRGARSSDQLTPFALFLNQMRFSVQTPLAPGGRPSVSEAALTWCTLEAMCGNHIFRPESTHATMPRRHQETVGSLVGSRSIRDAV